jgi:dolichol-phosphate mannosyltransferase
MSESQHTISVVVPVYGSERILPSTHERLSAVLGGLEDFDHEIVFVNDGSPDDAFSVLRTLAEKDPHTKVVSLSRNFGHQVAITAGLDTATGDVVVVIDDDLQDPPEVIARMVEKWREGYKVVYGVRSERKGENAFKMWTASAFYRMLRRLSDTPLPIDSGDFRLMDRAVVSALRSMREESRYLRGMVSWVGFSQYALEYSRDPRFEGSGNYTLGKMLKLALDGIFSFSSRPLAVSTQFGVIVTVLSFLMSIALIVQHFFFPQSVAVPGWTSVILAVLFMGGVQLMSVGVLGAYIGRVFYETKRRPLYFVAEALNTPAPDPSAHER